MQEAGMTQAQLARKMGISRASLSRILRGLRSPGSRFVAALKVAFPDKPMECFFDLNSSQGGHSPENHLQQEVSFERGVG
jgi:transcriptional regulator with XRE-family HTH domain